MRTEAWEQAEHFVATRALLSRRLQKPYEAYTSLVGDDKVAALALERDRRLLAQEQTMALVSWEESEACAIVAGSLLPWDSRQFGFTAARIDLLTAAGSYASARQKLVSILAAFLTKCQERSIRHLTARVGAGELATIHALECRGFELLDGIQTFALRLGQRPMDPDFGQTITRLSCPEDEDQIAEIARTAFSSDRFHADSTLTKSQADNLHEQWLRNSCRGSAADAVIVAETAGRILGFLTCRIDRETVGALGLSFGSIVLVATRESARGQGVAQRITQKALAWFRDHNVDLVEVGTQVRNVRAARLYQRAGFKLMDVSLTFRKSLPGSIRSVDVSPSL